MRVTYTFTFAHDVTRNPAEIGVSGKCVCRERHQGFESLLLRSVREKAHMPERASSGMVRFNVEFSVGRFDRLTCC